MLPFIQFVHMLFVLTMIGLYFSSFIYLVVNIKNDDVNLFRKILYVSLITDVVIFTMLIGLFLTGTLLVFLHHFSFSTPWIMVAYHLLALVGLFWLILFLIKLKNYRSGSRASFRFKKLFYFLNVCIFILLFFAVHDAVMRSTWFAPAYLARGNGDV